MQRFFGGKKTSDEELRRPDSSTGKKSSLRKTYKNRAEANDKVWLLNENTGKALGMLATNCKKFDVEFDQLEILTGEASGGPERGGLVV